MAGTVLGRYVKLVVSSLLLAGPVSQPLAARLAELDDDDDVPWDEFRLALAHASAHVDYRQQIEIGAAIMAATKDEFQRWGFDSAEAMLTDLDAPFGALLRDPPEHERLTTAKYEPGYAVFRVGISHPSGLIEGYLRGIVELHGGRVLELACHRVHMDALPYHLIELRWWTPARAVARRRPASGPRLVA